MDAVSAILRDCSLDIQWQYLDHLVFEKRSTDAALHTKLALVLTDAASAHMPPPVVDELQQLQLLEHVGARRGQLPVRVPAVIDVLQLCSLKVGGGTCWHFPFACGSLGTGVTCGERS
jgi:hypothetical protein